MQPASHPHGLRRRCTGPSCQFPIARGTEDRPLSPVYVAGRLPTGCLCRAAPRRRLAAAMPEQWWSFVDCTVASVAPCMCVSERRHSSSGQARGAAVLMANCCCAQQTRAGPRGSQISPPPTPGHAVVTIPSIKLAAVAAPPLPDPSALRCYTGLQHCTADVTVTTLTDPGDNPRLASCQLVPSND